MLNTLRARREDDEQGFTLIELMVVVLIIAILIAIAIPTFLGARKKAQDRAAQSDVRNALTAEKTHYTDAQAYTESSTDLEAIEPSLAYVTSASDLAPTGNVVYVDVASNVLTVGAESASGSCFFVKDDLTTGTQYASTSDCSLPASGDWTSKW